MSSVSKQGYGYIKHNLANLSLIQLDKYLLEIHNSMEIMEKRITKLEESNSVKD